MKFIKKYTVLLTTTIVVLSFLVLPSVYSVYAQQEIEICNPADGKICNPIKQSSITGFLASLLEGALRIALPVIVLAIIYCGFLFVAARGNPEELSKAKSALMYTLIGAAILLGSLALAKLVQSTVLAL